MEGAFIMSGKYVFSQALKEVRFLFCQTGEHSGPTRSVSFLHSSTSLYLGEGNLAVIAHYWS